MRVAAKDQLIIKSTTPYFSKLTIQKLLNTTLKKKFLECAKLAQNMTFYFHRTMGTNHFSQTIQYTEKIEKYKNAPKKLKKFTKITTTN